MAEADGGYDADFSEILSEDYTCPICQLALREPRLTHCGHQYCAGCIQRLFQDGKMVCSLCRMNLEESQIYPNNATKRQILSLQIRCPRRYIGCPWTGELRQQEHHESECGFVLEECNNKCGESIPRNAKLDHETHSCCRRTVKCSYCHGSMQHQVLEMHHQEECDSCPVSCIYDCGAIVSRSEMSTHVGRNGSCPNSLVECDFAHLGCQFECKSSEMDEHEKASTSAHLRLVVNELAKTKSELIDVKAELSVTRNELHLEMKQRMLSMPPGQFVYMWRIDKWSQAVSDAKTNKQRQLKSNGFFISKPGFQCYLAAYPNGTAEGANGYLSLYLLPVAGDDDDQLVWPFSSSFRLAVVDQRQNGKDVLKKYSPPYAKGSFDSPTGSGCGSAQFMSHNSLKASKYIKQDAILIKLVVDV